MSCIVGISVVLVLLEQCESLSGKQLCWILANDDGESSQRESKKKIAERGRRGKGTPEEGMGWGQEGGLT